MNENLEFRQGDTKIGKRRRESKRERKKVPREEYPYKQDMKT